jgi:tRNA-splicing ligase RtcB
MSNIEIVGQHEFNTIEQLKRCMTVGNAYKGVLCADGHLGYSQPVGAVIAYPEHISVSGCGYDIACGNKAVRLDIKMDEIRPNLQTIADDIGENIAFGVGRKMQTKVKSPLFDRGTRFEKLWQEADLDELKGLAESSLGTVGGGNHYVDIFEDIEGWVWIGVHFGSRGLGHKTATKFLKLGGGKDGIDVLPTLLHVNSDLGRSYLAGMELAGHYAYAGRDWVVEEVRKMIGGKIVDEVHNHHNFAWLEMHEGNEYWVVRKGATPAFPYERGFVGGSMGDDAVIIHGIDSPRANALLNSTVHGAGRVYGRRKAKETFTTEQMDQWCREKGVIRVGGDVDESPMAYRRLDEVLREHSDTIEIETILTPRIAVMAGKREVDPWKD